MWLDPPVVRTEYQRLPRSSAARAGSQHRLRLDVKPPSEVGSADAEGSALTISVPGRIESFEIHAWGLPPLGLTAPITRAGLSGSTAANVSACWPNSKLMLLLTDGLGSPRASTPPWVAEDCPCFVSPVSWEGSCPGGSRCWAHTSTAARSISSPPGSRTST